VVLTVVLVTSPVKADTVHTAEVYNRPTWPKDPVASSIRLAQRPSVGGAVMITVGGAVLRGGSITTLPVAVGLAKQSTELLLQNALSLLSRIVMTSPILVPFRLIISSVTSGVDALTVEAVNQVHDDFKAPGKVKRELHDHSVSVMPASSVGESKLIKKERSLSAKREVLRIGAGNNDDSDSS
jgi:hypothetical protein